MKLNSKQVHTSPPFNARTMNHTNKTSGEAAKRAGFTSRVSDTINMISEPEAAATYCLREMYSAQGGDNFRIGDRYIICDCGGGTVVSSSPSSMSGWSNF